MCLVLYGVWSRGQIPPSARRWIHLRPDRRFGARHNGHGADVRECAASMRADDLALLNIFEVGPVSRLFHGAIEISAAAVPAFSSLITLCMG